MVAARRGGHLRHLRRARDRADRRRRVPRRRKLLLGVLVGYVVFPIDLIPDFIPVAGHLDDAIVVALALRHLLRAGGPDLVREHWPGPEKSLAIVLRLAGGAPTR
jgi:uncharacterized membrane protein YkvA (DUF1232 family)